MMRCEYAVQTKGKWKRRHRCSLEAKHTVTVRREYFEKRVKRVEERIAYLCQNHKVVGEIKTIPLVSASDFSFAFYETIPWNYEVIKGNDALKEATAALNEVYAECGKIAAPIFKKLAEGGDLTNALERGIMVVEQIEEAEKRYLEATRDLKKAKDEIYG
jgi:hypothetical protein